MFGMKRTPEAQEAIKEARQARERAEDEARTILFEFKRRRSSVCDSLKFFKDPKLESIKRQCAMRMCSTVVINKAHDTRCQFLQKQVDLARNVYNRKTMALMNERRKALREHVGRRYVLDDIEKRSYNMAPSVGHVIWHRTALTLGPNSQEMHELIEKKIKENSPSARRRRITQELLRTHRQKEMRDIGTPRFLDLSLNIKKSVLNRPLQYELKGMNTNNNNYLCASSHGKTQLNMEQWQEKSSFKK